MPAMSFLPRSAMIGRSTFLLPLLLLALIVPPLSATGGPVKAPAKITWKKTVIDDAFRSEGVCVVDVNKDGRPDIIVGDCWYEAPKEKGGTWTRHILRADRKFDPRN